MDLQQVLRDYTESRDLERSTEFGYREAVRSLGEFLGRNATIDDLEPETLNRWLGWFKARGRSPHTIANRRRHLLVIARHCVLRGWRAALDERRIKSIKLPPTPKRIWTPAEVGRLVDAVERLEDRAMRPRGVRRRSFWKSLILTAWDTALRWSDLSRLTRWDINEDGSIDLVQHKTQVEHRVRLSRRTFAAIDESFAGLAGDRDLVWPCECNSWRHAEFRRLVAAAGLRGTFGQLRRSSIVAVERQCVGAGMLHAGHTKSDTTHRWYIPRREVLDLAPQPPEIGETMATDRNEAAPRPRGRYVHKLKAGESVELQSPSGEKVRCSIAKDRRGFAIIVEPSSDSWIINETRGVGA